MRFDAATIPVALAERRGNYVAVLFHSDNPDTSASCVVINRAGSGQVADINTSVGSSSGPSVTPPTGQLTVDGISQFGGDTPALFVDGAVGPGVAGRDYQGRRPARDRHCAQRTLRRIVAGNGGLH